ncbi:YonK family protein [Bacillus sp. FJAT-22090]|uniref:YonK family protein n=1 Tax=Bacillus sp. FJAT-22090 TaxID=1581038 RepID=UPI0011A222BE|nr:YonK family protein [Bacillus sp. FJAT-22090]
MAKENSGFSFKGELGYDDGRFYITEIKKDSEETFDLTAKMTQYVGRTLSISGKEELDIEPVSGV